MKNCKRKYWALIKKAKQRPRINRYAEKHHIIPRCMGGTNKKYNLVRLTAKEHYYVHEWLVKMYPDNIKLMQAWWCMCIITKNEKRYKVTASQYEKSKIKLCKMLSKNGGRKWTEEQKRKVSKSLKILWENLEYKTKMSEKQKGRKHTTVSKKLMSDKAKGKKKSKKHCKNLSMAFTGRKMSEETKKKKSDAMKIVWADPTYRKNTGLKISLGKLHKNK